MLKLVLSFQIKPILLLDLKGKTQFQTSRERKELLRRDKEHFSSFLKEFITVNKKNCLKGECPILELI